MKVFSQHNLHPVEFPTSKGLRKAALEVRPPALSDDESHMIRREFAESKPITLYQQDGQTRQEMIGGRGQHLDTRA